MSTGFAVALALAVGVIVGARFLLPGLPLRDRATKVLPADVALTVLGLIALAFHCGAMFFRGVVELVPGTEGVIADIRALGVASIIWYAVPALFVVLGLRRLPWGALAVVVVALLAIGVTMYDGGPLRQHLVAIFAGVVVMAAVIAALVRPALRSST